MVRLLHLRCYRRLTQVNASELLQTSRFMPVDAMPVRLCLRRVRHYLHTHP
jgi:hypothetical protein